MTKNKKIIIAGIIFILLTLCIVASVFAYLLIRRSKDKDKKPDTDTPIEENGSDENGVKTINYPPIMSQSELDEYFKKGSERFDVTLHHDSEGSYYEFEEDIQEILTYLVASSEYQIETYGELFQFNNSSEIKIKIYETVEVLNSSVFAEEKTDSPHGIIAFAKNNNTMYYVFDYKSVDIPKEKVIITATHEMTHTLQDNYSTYLASFMPKWYLEGTAMYFQYYPQYFNDNVDQSYPNSLYELEQFFSSTDSHAIVSGYIVAEEFCDYLISISSEEELISLMDETGLNLDEEFEKVYGDSPDNLYKEFLSDK